MKGKNHLKVYSRTSKDNSDTTDLQAFSYSKQNKNKLSSKVLIILKIFILPNLKGYFDSNLHDTKATFVGCSYLLPKDQNISQDSSVL